MLPKNMKALFVFIAFRRPPQAADNNKEPSDGNGKGNSGKGDTAWSSGSVPLVKFQVRGWYLVATRLEESAGTTQAFIFNTSVTDFDKSPRRQAAGRIFGAEISVSTGRPRNSRSTFTRSLAGSKRVTIASKP
jgi:hypothetical protein